MNFVIPKVLLFQLIGIVKSKIMGSQRRIIKVILELSKLKIDCF